MAELVLPLREELWVLLLRPVGSSRGLEAGAGFVFYQDEYLFWLFCHSCQHGACPLTITVLPARKPGLFKFFKASFPAQEAIGHALATDGLERPRAGKTGARSKTWRRVESKVILTPPEIKLGSVTLGKVGHNQRKAGHIGDLFRNSTWQR